MTRNLFIKFVFFTVVGIAGLTWGVQGNAAAATWCGVLAPANKESYPTPKNNDCITYGQNYTALTSLSGTSDQLKSQFITKMHGFENGQHLQQVGAVFVENQLWNSTSQLKYNITWEQRIGYSDVTFSIENHSYTQNSAYDTAQDKDIFYSSNSDTNLSLVIRSNGVVYVAIKLDCGNTVGDPLSLPPPPIVIAYKVDDSTGSTTGPYSSDTISATVGIPASPAIDSSQPATLNIKSGSITVSPANGINGWMVVAYEVYKYCNTVPGGTCGSTLYSKTAGTSWTYPNAKDGYVYYMRWFYQAIKPVTVKGSKVDTTGNTNPAIDGDTIRVTSSAGTASDSNNPFNITNLPTGSISVTPDPVPGWTVVGYTVCNTTSTTDCTPSNPLFVTSGSTYNINNATAGQTYNMYWKFSKNPPTGGGGRGGGGSSSCPSLPNPLVTVALPDNTPTPRTAPLATNSPNNHYTQYTPQLKTNVTNVQDISTGGSRVLSILNLTSQSYQQATVDYSPYITSYPYDSNQASVTYNTYFTVTNWVSASSPSYYTCSNNTQPNGNTCTGTITSGSNSTYTGTPHQTSVIAYYTGYTPCWRWNSTTHRAEYGNWSSCQTPVYKTVTTYSCDQGGTGGGASSVCYLSTATITTYTFPATAWYNYSIQSSYVTSNYNTANGLLMTECYDRGFNVTGVNANSANISLNNNENPSVATAGGYTATVRFFYTNVTPTQGLRLPMKVNLTYSYKFSSNSSIICTGNNNSFTVTGGFGPSGPSSYPITSGNSCGVSVPPLMPGDTVCATYSVSPTGSSANNVGGITSSNGGTSSSGPQCSGKIVNEPYFKVFGGDVSVGSTFATTSSSGAQSCTGNPSNPSAGVYGWNTAGGGGVYSQTYAGSGAQFAVTSPNVISGVASNQNNINANPSAGGSPNPLGLSFSNTANNSASAGLFGGSLTANCMTDFYSSLPTTGISPIGSGSISGLNGKYTMTGGSTITASDIGFGQHVTIYATGNIFIADNITFPNSYTSVDQIPSLILIVKGNIYISNSVKNLTGVYIAQPTTNSSADGYIYDCATAAGLPLSSSSVYSGCNNQLVVNGSFIANKVALMRTGISAPGSPYSSSLRGSTTTETNNSNSPAEIFNYGPAFWMNLSLPQSTSTGTSSAGYDSIISLPPIL